MANETASFFSMFLQSILWQTEISVLWYLHHYTSSLKTQAYAAEMFFDDYGCIYALRVANGECFASCTVVGCWGMKLCYPCSSQLLLPPVCGPARSPGCCARIAFLQQHHLHPLIFVFREWVCSCLWLQSKVVEPGRSRVFLFPQKRWIVMNNPKLLCVSSPFLLKIGVGWSIVETVCIYGSVSVAMRSLIFRTET